MAPIIPLHLTAQAISNVPSSRFPDAKLGGTVHWKTLLSAPDTPTDTFTAGIATCTAASASSSSSSQFPPPSSSPANITTPSTTPPCAAAPPSSGHLKMHRHTHPELYYIISGTGVVTIEGTENAVAEGSVVFIPGDAEHGVRATGKEDLKWLYVFGAGGFEEVTYRFSEGEGVRAGIKAKL